MAAEPLYLDPQASPGERAGDLLGRLSLQQKINQLGCELMLDDLDTTLLDEGIGFVSVVGGAESLAATAAAIRRIQERVIAQSSFGIPALFHAEAVNGAALAGFPQFPSALGVAAAFDPDLVRDLAAASGQALRAAGIRQALAPVLDLARDFRWGRTAETFGSDPALVAALGTAFAEGLQTTSLARGVAATGKHFLGYSQTEGGLNMTRTLATPRELRESFAVPFEAAIRQAGLAAVMCCFSEADGLPICASQALLDGLLRHGLGLKGPVISDAMAIGRLVDTFHIAASLGEAAARCLAAGVDVEIPVREAYAAPLREAVKQGRVDVALVDRAARRVLELKFALGLFERPFGDPAPPAPPDALSRRAALASLTLTKNDGLLPLAPGLKLAVIGPSGDSLRHLFGCYSYPAVLEIKQRAQLQKLFASLDTRLAAVHAEVAGRDETLDRLNERLAGEYPGALTLFAALERHFPGATFTPGCRTTGDAGLDLAAAATAAAAADAVVLAVGGKGGWGLSSTSGEGVDSTETGLPGRQRELAQAVIAANPRTAIVHLDGRPLIEPGLYEAAAAVLEAWFPGPDGAAAIADVLAGRAEPAGRLPVDVPRSVGQQPVFHGQHFGSRSDQPISNMINPDGYVNEPAQALLPFGAGLSYTAFAWDGFAVTLDESFPEPVITATCRVANTGRREGTEVVQLYGTDLVASLVRPQQVLLGFQRLTLAPGESRRVTFRAPVSLFAFPDEAGAWAVEAGGVTVRLASSARDVRFEAAVRLAGTITVDPARRSFLAASEVAP